MAYKKYIKKDGKIYGPYIYHSKRVDGKVVSEYRGSKKKLNINFLWIFLGVCVLIAAFYVSFNKPVLTGESVLDLNADYKEGEILEGKMSIFINKGELIPVNSSIIFLSKESTYKYDLENLVLEPFNEGDYYVEGTSISGKGEGYGFPGEKIVYPEIEFTLLVLSEKSIVPEEEENNTSNFSEKTTLPENNTSNNKSETSGNENKTSEKINSASTNKTNTNNTGILSNFFLGLTPTGNSVLNEKEFKASVSKNNPFEFELSNGETVEIKPRSIKTSSGKKVSKDELFLEIQNGKVIVTTNYSEKEQGFGEEYLGEELKEISLDISKLNLLLDKGRLNVSINYNENEIVSLSTVLEPGKISSNKTINNKSLNANEILNKTPQFDADVSKNISQTDILIEEINLSQSEKEILEEEFGNLSLEVDKAFTRNGFLTVRYSIGNYWIEHTYDADLESKTLEFLMKEDRIKWLKDIANSLSSEQKSEQEVSLPNEFNY